MPKFTHTLALSKLASFLDETQTESKKPQKPFLIAAYNERKNSYLVVGFVGFGIRGKSKIKCVTRAYTLTLTDSCSHFYSSHTRDRHVRSPAQCLT